MKVVVLHGEVSETASKDEQDVLVQVKTVACALAELGYRPVALPFSLDLRRVIRSLRSIDPIFVFNLVESVAGEGQLIHLAPTVLDYLRLPYTGAGTDAMFLTSNKVAAKRILQLGQVPTPEWLQLEDLNDDESIAHGPWIIKSIWEHASIGLDEDSVIVPKDAKHLRDELSSQRERMDRDCFAEAYIDGREFNLSLLAGQGGPEVLPAAEIRFVDYPEERIKVVGYRAKWNETSFEYHHTPRCFDLRDDGDLTMTLSELAKKCWRLFGLRGYARVDFRVDCGGRPWVLEINTNPCLSPDAGFLAAAAQAGIGLHEVVNRITKDSVPVNAREQTCDE
jgi:D-alanine-D-alanine ligase